MTTSYIQDITSCLGKDVAKYAANKRRGGNNGYNGFLYEEFYAISRLADIAQSAALSGNYSSGDWPHLQCQADAMVDDLVISWQDRTYYYQCKNVATIAWSTLPHSLENDFKYQIALSQHQGKPTPKTFLVVSDPQLATTLRNNMPSSIAAHSEVIEFPYCGGIMNRLVLEHAPLKSNLADLARVDNPTDDEIVYVFGALQIGMRIHVTTGLSEKMFASAQSGMPQLVRLLPEQMADFSYVAGFEEALAGIVGLQYGVERGFFHWQGFGTTFVFSSNCLSEQFLAYQQRVVTANPQTFDEFEVLK